MVAMAVRVMLQKVQGSLKGLGSTGPVASVQSSKTCHALDKSIGRALIQVP